MLGLGNPGKIVGCTCLPDGTCQFVQAAAGLGFNPAETPQWVGPHSTVHYDRTWGDGIPAVNPLSQRRLSSMQQILGETDETAKSTRRVLGVALAGTAVVGLAYLLLRKPRRRS